MKLIDNIIKNQNSKTCKKDAYLISKLPHIVILDEINRVDISRVFGELFTAMESEYRKEGIELPLSEDDNNPLKLVVPDNLYFIGTMNMIDFSLEQVDFALRRRFSWVESNYEEDRLKDIIDDNINNKGIGKLVKDGDNNIVIKDYISRCTQLNNLISEHPDLGPTYKIGHTFFAEVIDIYEKMNSQNKWESAKEFLWNISIRPMIDAYCGIMDAKTKNKFIGDKKTDHDCCFKRFMLSVNTEKNNDR